ncbi:Diacetylchitobiose uptake system permease protein NgcF [Anaerolineales bacterium]|nr:Diacetylchitobiose uptake system permease protein NgcF [Anaerolineales bacterium]
MNIAQARGDETGLLKRRYSRRRTKDYVTIALFLLPAVVLFLVFIIYPIVSSVYYSTFNWNGIGPAVKFVGLNNFNQILSDKVFVKAAGNALVIVVLSLAAQLPLALALAIMVGRDLPGRAFFRTIFFMPYVLSEVITGIVWLSLLSPDPERGLINALLVLFPGVQAQNFLGDMNAVMPCVFIVLTWKYFGLHMLLDMAGLQNIPKEVEEAAMIDGASRWQTVRYVTIPLLGSTLLTSTYLSVLGSLTQFNLIWIMTRGGPANASEVMATYMYRYAFIRFQLGYGSAVALVMLVICLVFSVAYLRLSRRPDPLSGI